MTFPDPEIIAVNNIELEVFQAGDPSHPAVMLCHGWPEHAYSWRHQIAPLAEAGYHVIVPNQRGYGHSSRPDAVTDYDITHLTSDLASLLDHFNHSQAAFVGHDWGAIVVWNMAMLQRERVAAVANLSVPFMDRGESEWVGFWESMLGGDFYIVHFNRQPGVADAAFANNCERFLRNIYRTNQWLEGPQDSTPGMPFLTIAESDSPTGDPLMPEEDLQVFVSAFEHSGFTGGINWYRNFTRNWSIVGEYEQKIHQPTLMIYGQYDIVPPSPTLDQVASNLETHTLPCGHWIQQEQPQETNRILGEWLSRQYPARG